MDAEMEQQKRHWWHALITLQNVLAAVSLVIGVTLAWQAQVHHDDVADDRMKRAEQRIEQLEGRLDKTVSDIGNIYMRRDNMELEMRAIRVEIQGMRRDLR